MKTIELIYEGGVFRPAEPVDLPEHTRLRLDVPDGKGHGNGHDEADPLAKYRGTMAWPSDGKPGVRMEQISGILPDFLKGEDPVAWQRRIRDAGECD